MHKEEPKSKLYSRPKMLWSRYVKTAHNHWAGEEFQHQPLPEQALDPPGVSFAFPGQCPCGYTDRRRCLCSTCPPALSVVMKNDQLLFPLFVFRELQRNHQPRKNSCCSCNSLSIDGLKCAAFGIDCQHQSWGGLTVGKANRMVGATPSGLQCAELCPGAGTGVCWDYRGILLCRVIINLKKVVFKSITP